MKKRVLSGLLAAMMLLTTTAFAAEGGSAGTATDDTSATAAEQTQSGTVLTFSVTLPDEFNTDRMEDAIAEQVRTVLVQRLSQLNLEGAQIDFPEDQQTVVVTLPADAETDGVAEFLAWQNALEFTDADGKVWLTGADVSESSVGFAEDGTPYIQISFTEEGGQTFAEALEASDALDVTMDGEQIAQVTAEDAGESGSCTLTGSFTEDEARLFVARIVAGELPVALTLTGTSTGETTDPAEPEQPAEPEVPADPSFPDIAGHWAEDALNTAVEMGLLNGVDGKILPNDPVKRSEAVVILNRVLGASVADSTSGLTGNPQGAWYTEDLGKAIHLGLIDANDSRNFNTASTRAEAFVLIARAFVYDRAESAADELSAFTDTGSMTDEQLQAAAALVAEGIVNGSTATTLSPDAQLTRAEFVTMVTRIADNILVPQEETEQPDTGDSAESDATEENTQQTEDNGQQDEEQPAEAAQQSSIRGGSIISLPQSELSDTVIRGDLIYAAAASDITLDAVTSGDRVVLKGAEQTALSASNGTALSILAIDPAGSAEVDLSSDSAADTLVIAGKGGAVNFNGAADDIEITASNRTINLTGMQASTLTVTGTGNTIIVDGDIGAIAINGGAKNNTLTLNGNTETLLVAGVGSTVGGSGKAGSVDIRAVDCTVTVAADSVVENIDQGLSGVSIQMGVPTKVTPGGSLLTQVTFTGVTEDKVCSAQWYQDGKALEGYGNDHFALSSDAVSRHTTYFTFTKDMQTSVTMGFKLTYDNPSTGEVEELYVEKTVPIENYSDDWYYQRDVNRILNLVSSTYRGNYTTAYAVNGDYSQTEKEIWINAKGYSSNTQYLLWINRAYQHVNVFQGSKGNWKMIKSFLVGTGAASTPTPTGLTTVSYKSAAGWTTSTYTVRPVVGFYPGTGYAFHSRLCYPGTDTEYDYSAGYPVSHGCVRMYKSDINWIYNNIPVGTAVVIF